MSQVLGGKRSSESAGGRVGTNEIERDAKERTRERYDMAKAEANNKK